MGFLKTFSLLFVLIITGSSLYCYFNCKQIEIPSKYFEDAYWIQGTETTGIPKDSTELKKFPINIDEKILTDLKLRLNLTKFTQPLQESNFNYGFNGDYLKEVVEYWLNKYNWRNIEKQLNQFEHYKTQIEGLQVHYVHVKPEQTKGVTILPLMLVHGWPGSFYEFMKVIPLLSKPVDGIAFELVIPSIPGYGFSQAAEKQGLSIFDVARIFNKLMKRLGHQKYYYHGGDWGAGIGRILGIMYPERLAGFHTSMPTTQHSTPCNIVKLAIAYVLPNLIFENPEVESKSVFPLLDKMTTLLRESGYAHLQATKPDTVSAALINSPAGLAAYILEKFSSWTDMKYINKPNGGLTEKFTLDELLTNIMIYWVTDSFPSSARLYKESLFSVLFSKYSKVKFPASIPVGIASFPNEIPLITLPKIFTKEAYPNIIQFNYMKKGGHFPAFEEPELTANDIREFIQKCVQLEAEKEAAKKQEADKKKEL